MRRGVDVRVIVPGEYTDVPIVRHAGRFQYSQLLRRGIRIFEYQPTMMHAKTMVVDGIWTTIGSSNFDDRSFRLNDEVNVNVYDEDHRRADGADVLRRPRPQRGDHRAAWLQRPWWTAEGEGGGVVQAAAVARSVQSASEGSG